MLALISPAKTQDFQSQAPVAINSNLSFMEESQELISELRKYNSAQLGKLMQISDSLATLNFNRYQAIDLRESNNAKQAMFTFQGDVYKTLDAASLNTEDINFAQHSLAIISGLYGLLKPLDAIQAYRLEMKTALSNSKGKNLYEFWGDKLTNKLNDWLANNNKKYIINLASNEYYKALQPRKIDASFINIDFKENKNGQLKTIGIFAKRARGLMARYIIKNKLQDVNDIQKFNLDGYKLNSNLSTDSKLVFSRGT